MWASSKISRASPPLKLLLHRELGLCGVKLKALVRESVPRVASPQFGIDCGEGHFQSRRQVLGCGALFPQRLEVLPGLERAESVACHVIHLFSGIKN